MSAVRIGALPDVLRRPETMVDLLDRRAEAHPERPLAHLGGDRVTLGALREASLDCGLRLAGVLRPGAPVMTLLKPGLGHLSVLFGLARAGGIDVPVRQGSTPEQALALAGQTDSRVLVVDSASASAHREVVEALGEHGVTVLLAPYSADTDPPLPRIDELAPLPRGLLPRDIGPGSPSVVVATSGTTGLPKAAVLPHFAGIRQARRVSSAMGWGPDDVVLSVFPWHHIMARHAGLLAALHSGATLVAAQGFSASRFWDTCRRHGVTSFHFLGAVLAILARQPATDRDADHQVRTGYGGPAPTHLRAMFAERFGVELREAYACTELADVAVTGPGESRPDTAGKVVPEYDVQIRDDAGNVLPAGAVGQIVVRPRHPAITFRGYLGDPGATDAVVHEGWFLTGDRASIDEDGYLSYVGRLRDVVRRRGETVSAWEVEQVVLRHPDVSEAAVVPVPSELTEDELLLVVAPVTGNVSRPEDLRTWCQGRIPAYAVPRFIRFVDRLPRNASGRVVKTELVEHGVRGAWDAERRS